MVRVILAPHEAVLEMVVDFGHGRPSDSLQSYKILICLFRVPLLLLMKLVFATHQRQYV